MDTHFRNWLARLLLHGESFQENPPRIEARDESGIQEELHMAFDRCALDVAGPQIAFDPGIARQAAELVASSCWQLLDGTLQGSPPLILPREPATPSEHLSADVLLRFLPSVYRRARAQDPVGPLARELDCLLRAWPLSGVLADVDGEPTNRLDFDGHAGLQMLYAERFAGTRRIGWLPPPGASREWVERVFHERRLSLPAPAPQPRDT